MRDTLNGVRQRNELAKRVRVALLSYPAGPAQRLADLIEPLIEAHEAAQRGERE